MGGENPSVLSADKPAKQELKADEVIDLREPRAAQKDKKRKTDKSKKKPKQPKPPKQPKQQLRNLEQHVKDGECHFHDRNSVLKGAVPVAEMNHASRELRRMKKYKWVDMKNKTLVTFTPQLHDGEINVVVEVDSVKVGERFTQLYELTGK